MSKKISITLVSFLILFTYQFPNYFAFIKTPVNKFYTGTAYLFDPWDVNVYIASINWSQEFGFYFQNAYTTIPHQPVLFYPLYIFTGSLLKTVSPLLLYYILTISSSFLLILTIYQISKLFLSKHLYVLASVILTTLGGGLGWYFIFRGFDSPDVTLTPFTLASAFQKPHELLALSFYFLSLSLFYLGVNKKSTLLALASAFAFIAVIFFYPYYILSYLLIIFSYSLIVWRKEGKKEAIRLGIIITLLTLPITILYSKYLLSSDSFGSVTSPLLSGPTLTGILGGYGVLDIFVLLQLLNRKKTEKSLFLLIWLFTSILLTFLPFGFSRYFLRGLFFPCVLLSLMYLENPPKLFKKYEKLIYLTILFLVPLNSILIFKTRMEVVKDASIRFVYINSEEKEAMDFLKNNTSPGSGVLADYILGNFIPVFTYNRVYYGHNTQTPNAPEKIVNLTKFYSNEFSDQDAKKFLKDEGISFIVWGPDEKQITKESGTSVLKYSFLESVFSNHLVKIFSYK